MNKTQQQALQVAKEIMVKFIEVGRISPSNFPEHFATIYGEVLHTVSSSLDDTLEPQNPCPDKESS